jgi:hypothetical protein
MLINFLESSNMSVELWSLNQKAPARWLVPAKHQSSVKGCPAPTQVPRCQLAGFEHSFWPLHRKYAVLFVKTNGSHAIFLINGVPHVEAISSRIYSDRLDPSGPDKNCFVLRYLVPNPTKEFQSPKHNHIFQPQLINKSVNKRLSVRIILGDYNMLIYTPERSSYTFICQW